MMLFKIQIYHLKLRLSFLWVVLVKIQIKSLIRNEGSRKVQLIKDAYVDGFIEMLLFRGCSDTLSGEMKAVDTCNERYF